MVIPWIGFPLAELIKRVAADRQRQSTCSSSRWPIRRRCPDCRRRVLDWPYSEGLRMDEAMHPLTLLTIGLYGEVLPNQNGAPVRVVVPWKYGFKSAKSLVKIRFVEKQPPTSWNTYAPSEYGFYSNVNPERRSSALEPGDRAAHRRGRFLHAQAQDADVQRLRRSGRVAVSGHGPEEEFLSGDHGLDTQSAGQTDRKTPRAQASARLRRNVPQLARAGSCRPKSPCSSRRGIRSRVSCCSA